MTRHVSLLIRSPPKQPPTSPPHISDTTPPRGDAPSLVLKPPSLTRAHILPKLLPHIADDLEIRRVWRGLYANTADGNPLVGWDRTFGGLFHAVGMGGQGFMLGPGVGKLVARVLQAGDKNHSLSEKDEVILKEMAPWRNMSGGEELLR